MNNPEQEEKNVEQLLAGFLQALIDEQRVCMTSEALNRIIAHSEEK